MTLKELVQKYHNMIQSQNYADASSIAFKIAGLISKEEPGWCECTSLKCQEWMNLGYQNAIKSQNTISKNI